MGSRDAGDGAVAATYKDKSVWHNNRGERGWNLMYGDGHVAMFRFPRNFGPSQMSMAVNRTNAWW
jgi:hypothetical protein